VFTIHFPSLIASLYPNKIIYELVADIPLPIFAIQIIRLWTQSFSYLIYLTGVYLPRMINSKIREEKLETLVSRSAVPIIDLAHCGKFPHPIPFK